MKYTIATTLIATLSTFSADAEVRINGFANLVGGVTSSDDSLNGFDDSISFTQDSLFAIQVSGDINDRMTATGQIIARGENDYKAEFEWAYISFQVTDEFSVSGGRLRLPLFRYSSSLDVGYSYHWISAPQAVYNVPANNIDGVRLDYSSYLGDWEYNAQLAAGTIDSVFAGSDFTGENVLVVSLEATYEWFKIRGVVGRARATLNVEQLAPLFGSLTEAGLGSLADNLELKDDTGTFMGIGVELDKGSWFVSAEVAEIEFENSFSPTTTAYYLTTGMVMGVFTPSITFESMNTDENDIKFFSQIDPLPDPFRSALIGLQQGSKQDYDTVTLGFRYDVADNTAFKIDASKYSDNRVDNDVTLVKFAVNYIF